MRMIERNRQVWPGEWSFIFRRRFLLKDGSKCLDLRKADGCFKHGSARLLITLGGHTNNGSGETDGCDDGSSRRANRRAVADASHDRFFSVAGDAGLANFGELLEEARAVGDGVLGATGKAVNFDD